MVHPIHKVSSFTFRSTYTLDIHFDDGISVTIDFEPILHGELFGPLREPSFFKRARIDPEVCTIVWPNGADFDPALLRNWDQYRDELIDRASKWETVSS